MPRPSRSSPASLHQSSSSSKRHRGSSSPVTAFASRSRARTGRTRGPHRSQAVSRSRGRASSWISPCSTGHRLPRLRCSSNPGRHIEAMTRRTSNRPWCVSSSTTAWGDRRGSPRATAFATRPLRREDRGAVRRSRRRRRDGNPGRAWASARTRYSIEWPEASVSTEAHLRMRSSSSAYHVVVEVIASEEGPDGIGHVERRFERTIPRRLQ